MALATTGDDFAVMGMHFKLGLYEHQSAGAIQGLMDLLEAHRALLDDPAGLRRICISIYEPALGIIGDPAKRDPRTRQSADHSMVYIIATLLRKAYALQTSGWKELMLVPNDYSDQSLHDPLTRQIMEKIEFRHGGPEYDALYPDGIPTRLDIEHARLGHLSSGLVMYPEGHARCTSGNLDDLLAHKLRTLAASAVDDVDGFLRRFSQLSHSSTEQVARLYAFEIRGVDNTDS